MVWRTCVRDGRNVFYPRGTNGVVPLVGTLHGQFGVHWELPVLSFILALRVSSASIRDTSMSKRWPSDALQYRLGLHDTMSRETIKSILENVCHTHAKSFTKPSLNNLRIPKNETTR